MQSALVVLQIIFYSVASLAIIVLFLFVAIAGYRLIKILKELQAVARDVRNISDEAKEKIEDIIEKLSLLPILSFFIKKRKKSGNPKRKTEKK